MSLILRVLLFPDFNVIPARFKLGTLHTVHFLVIHSAMRVGASSEVQQLHSHISVVYECECDSSLLTT
jgi:hypothetical protein